jgi:hypothetical protein
VATQREFDEKQKLLKKLNRLREEAIKLATTLDLQLKEGGLDERTAWATRVLSGRLRECAALEPSVSDTTSETDAVNVVGPELEIPFFYSEAIKIIDALKVVRRALFNIEFEAPQRDFDPASIKIPND